MNGEERLHAREVEARLAALTTIVEQMAHGEIALTRPTADGILGLVESARIHMKAMGIS